jgi:hypothetical protein
MKFTNDLFGSNLMFAITTGLYSRNLSCIREYVQNSYDEPSGASNVNISLENGINLVIKDNGKGMDEEQLTKALGVGLYTKNFEKSEGMYGIGIWSGVSVCNKLVIITKKEDTKQKLRIEINSKGIRDNATNNIPALVFLSDNTGDIERIDVPEKEYKESYTTIRLEDITPGGTDLFTEKKLIEYISKNLPVPVYKDFEFYQEIVKTFEKSGYYRSINITVNASEVYRLYEVPEELREFETKMFNYGGTGIASCWFSLNKNGDALKKDRGFTLRHNGFVIRDWQNLKSEINGRFNDRFLGEIHLICNNPNLKPTAPRNDLIQNEVSMELYNQIRQFFLKLQRINSYVTVNIASPRKKIQDIERVGSLEEKKKRVSEIQNKNFQESLDFLKKDPSLEKLGKQLQQESAQVHDEFTRVNEEIKEEVKRNPPGRTELKKAVSSMTSDKELQKTINTLMVEKHEGDFTIDPFNPLKEKIEKLTKKKFPNFTQACDEIGKTITLFEGADSEKDSNDDVKSFFKSAFRIFRNIPVHAKGSKSTDWFDNSANREAIKAGVMALLTLINNMIDRMKLKAGS